MLDSINAKQSLQATDQDLQNFSEVEGGREIVTELNLMGARLTDTGLKAVGWEF